MATTPVDHEVANKMSHYLTMDGCFGNATSNHAYGSQASNAIETAREQVANLIQADSREIIWTSGATESNNLAIIGAARFYHRKGKHIITLSTEHKSVLDPCHYLQQQGYEVSYLKPQSNGLIDTDQLQASIRSDTVLISVMHVNNEIGVIQNIKQLATLAKQHGVLFHCDAAQSAGKIEINVQDMPVDLMSFSAHKVYGPKGIGALYIRRQPRVRLQPLLFGGGHESGLRSGTLPAHQIVGMGCAFAIAKTKLQDNAKRILQLRNLLWNGINDLPGLHINGDWQQRVPGNLNISVEGVEGESLLFALNALALSSASACTSASIEPSYVLRALGVPNELAHATLRISLGRFTTQKEIEVSIKQIREQINRLRTLSPL